MVKFLKVMDKKVGERDVMPSKAECQQNDGSTTIRVRKYEFDNPHTSSALMDPRPPEASRSVMHPQPILVMVTRQVVASNAIPAKVSVMSEC